MKKIISLTIILILFSCNIFFASSSGGVPKPFCKISEAATKTDSYFKEWFDSVGVKNYEDYFIQEIRYTNYYESARGNLLKGLWAWVIKFQSSKLSTYSYTLVLKEDGTIEIINVTK